MLKTKLVYVRMDQNLQRVHVTQRTHRTFGRQQWQALHDTLAQWQQQLTSVKDSMAAIAQAPVIPAK